MVKRTTGLRGAPGAARDLRKGSRNLRSRNLRKGSRNLRSRNQHKGSQ